MEKSGFQLVNHFCNNVSKAPLIHGRQLWKDWNPHAVYSTSIFLWRNLFYSIIEFLGLEVHAWNLEIFKRHKTCGIFLLFYNISCVADPRTMIWTLAALFHFPLVPRFLSLPSFAPWMPSLTSSTPTRLRRLLVEMRTELESSRWAVHLLPCYVSRWQQIQGWLIMKVK